MRDDWTEKDLTDVERDIANMPASMTHHLMLKRDEIQRALDARSKHTPGPWYQDETAEDGAPGVWASSNGALVALCVQGEDEDGNRIWEREAWDNAALVAAAPEMLAALKMLRDAKRESTQDLRRVADRILDAAIDKAEGR